MPQNDHLTLIGSVAFNISAGRYHLYQLLSESFSDAISTVYLAPRASGSVASLWRLSYIVDLNLTAILPSLTWRPGGWRLRFKILQTLPNNGETADSEQSLI